MAAHEDGGHNDLDCLVEGQVEPDFPLFFIKIESTVFGSLTLNTDGPPHVPPPWMK